MHEPMNLILQQLTVAADALERALQLGEQHAHIIGETGMDLASFAANLRHVIEIGDVGPEDPASFAASLIGDDAPTTRQPAPYGVLDDRFGVCAQWAEVDYATPPSNRFGVLDHDHGVPAHV